MAFVCAERMARTERTGQTCQIGVAGPTMLALVFGLLAAVIQGVFAFVRASRVARTGCSRQAGDAGGFGSAMLTVNSFSARPHILL
jgi:hypothetical protein